MSAVVPLAFGLWLTSAAAMAQPVEGVVPDRPAAEPVSIAPDLAPVTGADTRPIAGPLKSVVFLGPRDPLVAGPGALVDVTLVPRMDAPGLIGRIAPFLGQPISLALIAEIEAEVARYYREIGFPFVAISTPPQEVTDGVLQFRVVEFHAGAVHASGGVRADAAHLTSRVRVQSGDPIDARLLGEDVEWLNRSPFRRVEAIFGPGDALGAADLDLRVAEDRPWQVFAGYNNTGSLATGRDRIFAGATFGDFGLADTLASVQVTSSTDFLSEDGLASGGIDPVFLSLGGFVAVPVAPRQELEVTASHVRSRQMVDVFEVHNQLTELRLAHIGAVSNWPGFDRPAGNASFGVDLAHQSRESYFDPDDPPVSQVELAIVEGFVSWSHVLAGDRSTTALSASGHVSPGNLFDLNADAAFDAMTMGRVTSAQYGYARGGLEHAQDLGAGFTGIVAINAQAASGPLPDTAQLTLGGVEAVRGYLPDDGGYDQGVVLRTELRLPVVGEGATSLQGFGFADAGHGGNLDAGAVGVTAASVGVGADFVLSQHLTGSAILAYALLDGPQTSAGDTLVHLRATARY